jgi:hypothetical protein
MQKPASEIAIPDALLGPRNPENGELTGLRPLIEK